MTTITRLWARLPWYGAAAVVVLGAAGASGFSYVFTSDLFNEECLNERNLLTGEFEASNCGEGAKIARAQAETPSPTAVSEETDIPMSTTEAETATPSATAASATPVPAGEPSPEPTQTEEPTGTGEPEGPGVLLRGTFQDGDPGHDGEGTAEIQRLADGSLNLFLSDFSVTNGPDLFVVLVRDPGGDYSDGDLVLEVLKANNGNQNYTIPAGTDLSQYGAVLIWCRAFDIEFAFATLGGVQ